MTTKDDRLLSYGDINTLSGIGVSTLRRYKALGYMPDPDDVSVPDRPRWHESTITTWLATRPGRGAPGQPRPSRRKAE